MKTKKWKRIGALLLSFCLAAGMLPSLPGMSTIVHAAVPDVTKLSTKESALDVNGPKILFESTAQAASSDGTLKTEEAVTLRYASDSLGSAVINPSKTGVAVSGAPKGTYLVVQNSDGAWAIKVSKDVTIEAKAVLIKGAALSSFADCKVWLESTDSEKITTAAMAVQAVEHKVGVTPGANMTKTENSGAKDQTVPAGSSITKIVYTANAGYHFPETYAVTAQNGIAVSRVSDTQITVSGKPSADAAIKLEGATKDAAVPPADATEDADVPPAGATEDTDNTVTDVTEKTDQAAPTGLSGGAEQIIGTTAAMEHAKAEDAEDWTTCSDSVTAAAAGTWYVRYKETDTHKASPAVKVTVTSVTYTITTAPEIEDFGTVNAGYAQPGARTITVRNTGSGPLSLTQPTGTNFDIGSLSATELAAGAEATFTLQPKAALRAGAYKETITVNTNQQATASVEVSFKVNKAFSVAISPDKAEIIKGQSQTLTANPAGGSGTYAYRWYAGNAADSFAETKEVTVSPEASATYKVVVTDAVEAREATAAVTVIPATYTIKVSPESKDFGMVNEGYTKPGAQTVTVRNTGNSAVTLPQPGGANFDIGNLSKTGLAPGEEASFTVQPKEGLEAGNYKETITVKTNQETTASLDVSFKVNEELSLTVSPESAKINEGESQTLTAKPEGGSGNYTYKWFAGNAADSFAVTKEVRVSPKATTTYKVVVSDTIQEKQVSVTVTVKPKPPAAPKIIEGAKGTWKKGSKDGLAFKSDGDFDEFVKVVVDGKKIDSSKYTSKEGSTVVTLMPKYLETLKLGKHTLGIVSKNGTAETTFKILAKDSLTPRTGDSSSPLLWIAVMTGGIGALVVVFIFKKKRQR